MAAEILGAVRLLPPGPPASIPLLQNPNQQLVVLLIEVPKRDYIGTLYYKYYNNQLYSPRIIPSSAIVCHRGVKQANVNLEKPKLTKRPEVASPTNEPAANKYTYMGTGRCRNERDVDAAVRKGVAVRDDRRRRLLVRAARGEHAKRASSYRESEGSGFQA